MNYFCILTHGDDAASVTRCIQSIRMTVEMHHYEIMVLAQAVSDEVDHTIQKLVDSKMSYHRSHQNLGAIGGRLRISDMLLSEMLKQDVVFWIDDDVQAALPGWDELMAEAALKYGIASQVCVDVRPDWADFREPPDLEIQPGLYDVCGGGMTAMRGEYLVRGCEYNQDYLPFWHADADYCFQAKEKGAQVWGCYAGLQHKFNHAGAHDFYWIRNFCKLRNRWKGKGLVKFENDTIREKG